MAFYQHVVSSYLSNELSLTNLDQNALSCPIGVIALLTMLLGSGGPRGRTAEQLGQGLRLPSKHRTKISERLYQHLTGSLEGASSKTADGMLQNVRISNALVLEKGYPIEQSFQRKMESTFKSAVYSVDFKRPTPALKVINDWARERSNNLIQNLLSADQLNPSMRLMLLNLVVFKDNWAVTFDEKNTKTGTFTQAARETIQIPMMSLEDQMYLVDSTDQGFRALKIPMSNQRFSFIIILPRKRFDLRSVNSVLYRTKSINQLFEKSVEPLVALTLPKFELQVELDVKSIAQRMGIKDLFDVRAANLTGITKTEQLAVNQAKQLSVLRVNEYGIEAAAATYFSFGTRMIRNSVEFKVDQPFGCMIHDQELDIPLFVARVINPAGGKVLQNGKQKKSESAIIFPDH